MINFTKRNQIKQITVSADRPVLLTESDPVVLDSLIEHGCQPQLGLFTDVCAADDEPDPVGLVEGDAHMRLYFGY